MLLQAYWKLDDKLKSEIIKMASEYNITVYDASYLALATLIKASFCTSDDVLLTKLLNKKLGT